MNLSAQNSGRSSTKSWTLFPKEERAVVDLLWFDGLTQAEAAIALGVSERSIGRKWYSARYFLFKALGHES